MLADKRQKKKQKTTINKWVKDVKEDLSAWVVKIVPEGQELENLFHLKEYTSNHISVCIF